MSEREQHAACDEWLQTRRSFCRTPNVWKPIGQWNAKFAVPLTVQLAGGEKERDEIVTFWSSVELNVGRPAPKAATAASSGDA